MILILKGTPPLALEPKATYEGSVDGQDRVLMTLDWPNDGILCSLDGKLLPEFVSCKLAGGTSIKLSPR